MKQRVIRRLAAIEVTVPSPAESASFFASALDFARHGEDGTEHLTTEGEYGLETPARMLSLVAGPELGVAGVTFEVGSESDLTVVREHLEHLGSKHEPVEEDAVGGAGERFIAPGGVPITCRLPARALEPTLAPSDVRPRRLGHVNIKVPEPPASASFFCDALGLRLTEQLGEMLYFLRVNSDHHNLAFRVSDAPNVHHVAFEVQGWDSLRLICDHLAARNYQIEYGPGRHAPGHQLFLYLRDPLSGLRLELFTDMAHIDDEETFRPIRRDIDRTRSVNIWGPAPPASFLE
jgi:catechol 2,3-dioxygenase-like lactoylglutathione lyase family enzyme